MTGSAVGVLLAIIALGGPAYAQTTLNWDPNGTTAGIGGAGTWNTSTNRWTPNSDGTTGPHVQWVNGDNTAVFRGSAGYTVTLGTPITAGDLSVIGINVTLTGSTLTLVGTPTIDVTASNFIAINSALAGTAGLTKTGGTLQLGGSKTLTGGLTINGLLTISGSAWSGAGPGVVTVNSGGTLAFSGVSNGLGSTTAAANLIVNAGSRVNVGSGTTQNHNATLTGGTVNVTNFGVWSGSFVLTSSTLANLGGTGTFSGNLADTGANVLSLNFSSASTTTTILSGTNTYTGTTTIGQGTLQAGSTSAFSVNSAVTLGTSASATLNLNGFNNSIGSLAGGGPAGGNVVLGAATLTTGGNNTSTSFAGVISGTGGLIKTGLGTQVLTGTNSYTGGTVISGGTLQLGNGGSGGSIVGDVLNNGALVFNRSDALGFGGVISGSGTVTQAGTGTTTLAGANSYAGGTLLNAGILQVAVDANLGAAAGGLTFNGGTLQNTAAFATARPITINAGSGTFQTDADLTVSSAVGGSGPLVKTGSATLILTADNTYAGGATIAAGTLQLGNGGTSGSIQGDVVNNGALAFNRSDTFTFSGAISGTGVVNQIGGGTTVLTGNSTYTGGTTISAGTLQLGNGGTSGSIVGDVVNNGALAFNRSDTFTFAGVISGSGVVNQDGSGTTILTAVSPYTGATNVNAGTLALAPGAALSGPGTVMVAPGATLGGYGSVAGTVINNGTIAVANTLPVFAGGPTGNFTILGTNTLINNGVVTIGVPGTPVGNTLTTVSYVGGAGSTIRINTVLAGDASPSDRLIIDGGTATGSSALAVSNAGGGGVLTTGNGIQVVSAISGATTATGAFTLAVPLVAGPYEYLLFQGGANGSDPQSWFLRSTLDCALSPNDPACQQIVAPPGDPLVPNFRAEVSLYAAIPSMALLYGQALLGTLHQRAGEPEQLRSGQSQSLRGRNELSDLSGGETFSGGWGRILMRHGSQDGGRGGVLGSDGPKYNYDLYALQVGTDIYRREGSDGSRDQGGAYVAFGQIAGDVRHFTGVRAGRDTLQAWSLGAYWTHFGAPGWYVDAVAQGTWYDAKSRSSRDVAALKTTGFGLAASLEGGYPIALKPGWTVEPQAQLVWQRIWLDSANDGAATVKFSNVESFAGRLGARLMTTWQEAGDGAAAERRKMSVWLRANLWHEFSGKSKTTFSSADGPVSFRAALGGTSVEFTLGVTAQFTRSTSFFASAGYQAGFDRNAQAYEGRAGLRITW